MIKVQLVTNDGNGLPQQVSVREGTTIQELLDIHFDGDVEDFSIQVRKLEQPSRAADSDDQLEDGCRITLAPRKVEGAVTL